MTAWQKAIENIPKRHPTEPFDTLAQEVDQLNKSLLSVETVRGLADSLQSNKDDSCLNRLETWQISIVKFVGDFKAKFSSYQDITVPILAGVTDIMTAMQDLKTQRLSYSTVESYDRLRYLLLEIDSLPDKNLDLILASSENLDLITCADVLRDLGRSWLSGQIAAAEEKDESSKSIVFKFRDGEDPEETAGKIFNIAFLVDF